jgi:hypothetical protein
MTLLNVHWEHSSLGLTGSLACLAAAAAAADYALNNDS